MNSKVINLADFSRILDNFYIKEYELDEKSYNDELELIRMKNKIKKSCSQISINDIAVVNLKCDAGKFDKKNLRIIVGKNYFSDELENKLIGLKRGARKDMILEGLKIEAEVIDIYHYVLPEITDDLIKKENIFNVYTVSSFRNNFYNTNRDLFIHEEVIKLCIEIFKFLIKKSQFELDHNDISYMTEEMMNHYEITAKKAGSVLQEMDDNQIKTMFFADSLSDLQKRELKFSTDLVKIAAVCGKVLDIDISSFPANRNNVLKLQNQFSEHIKKLLKI